MHKRCIKLYQILEENRVTIMSKKFNWYYLNPKELETVYSFKCENIKESNREEEFYF